MSSGRSVRFARPTESMQEGLREVRSELYAAQQLRDDTEQRCAIEGQQAEVALRQEEQPIQVKVVSMLAARRT